MKEQTTYWLIISPAMRTQVPRSCVVRRHIIGKNRNKMKPFIIQVIFFSLLRKYLVANSGSAIVNMYANVFFSLTTKFSDKKGVVQNYYIAIKNTHHVCSNMLFTQDRICHVNLDGIIIFFRRRICTLNNQLKYLVQYALKVKKKSRYRQVQQYFIMVVRFYKD